jgi:hypothetical protein
MTTPEDAAKYRDRIKALLAKAESTDSPDEAKALSEKAAALADKYRVDLASLVDDDHPITFGLYTHTLAGTKYLRASLLLLKVVATHYGVVTITPATGNSKAPVLAGTKDDIDLTLMMFGSLVIQRDREVMATPVPFWAESTVTFRTSFAYGYAQQIHNRLEALRAAQKAAAESEVREGGADAAHGSTSLALFERADQVMAWATAGMPNVKSGRVHHNAPTLDGGGIRAGQRAADRADLGQTRVGANPSARAIG